MVAAYCETFEAARRFVLAAKAGGFFHGHKFAHFPRSF